MLPNVNVDATPVKPLPSPTNEPVIVEEPPASPKVSPLTLPLPKSVATLSNWAEPLITELSFKTVTTSESV